MWILSIFGCNRERFVNQNILLPLHLTFLTYLFEVLMKQLLAYSRSSHSTLSVLAELTLSVPNNITNTLDWLLQVSKKARKSVTSPWIRRWMFCWTIFIYHWFKVHVTWQQIPHIFVPSYFRGYLSRLTIPRALYLTTSANCPNKCPDLVWNFPSRQVQS